MTQQTDTQSHPAPKHRRRRRHWRIFLGFAALAGLIYAIPAYAHGWRRWRHHEPTLEDVQERLQQGAERLLDRVDATDAQEAQVDGIIDGVAPRILELKAEGRTLREQLMVVLASDEIDADEARRLKGEIDALVDRASSMAFDALLEVANVLTSEQRADLAEEWEKWHR